jgi:hypothetical protein
VDTIVRDFIEHERRHIMTEDRDFFPAALKALEPQKSALRNARPALPLAADIRRDDSASRSAAA